MNENPNCIKHEFCKSQYFNIINEEYVCWSCFKEMFHSKDNESEFISNILLSFQDAFVQNTFRTQDSENWSGTRYAFEQNLVEKGINWFVYIKFYLNRDNKYIPLVVGKSGSLLVNYYGSDVSFSTLENHGPARKFLSEENLDWDKTKIFILPCNSEITALITEKYLQNTHNLFGS